MPSTTGSVEGEGEDASAPPPPPPHATSALPTHVTESLSDRRKAKEMAEARASGAVAPEVDVKTGSMINPHNPEFITKRPWYLGGAGTGPSLDHQADQRADADRLELSLGGADALVREERDRLRRERKGGELKLGAWVEALRKGRKPYRICQIVRVAKNGTVFDLRYDDDGYVERNVKFDRKRWLRNIAGGGGGKFDPRIRLTKAGTRAIEIDHATHGKETYDSKRDAYLGYEVDMKRMEEKFQRRDELRRKKRKEEEERLEKEREEEEARDREKERERGDNGGGNGSNDGGKGERPPPPPTTSSSAAHAARSDSDSDSDVDSDSEGGHGAGGGGGGDDDSSDDEFVQRDEDAKIHTSRLARQGGVGGAQMKVTARNLRIREDTAKYLRNLDPSSAYYDPKSRSMRDNPDPERHHRGGNHLSEEPEFAGDNFARISGDAIGLAETQMFAWDAEKRSGGAVAIHPQADPSRAELLKRQFKGKKQDLKSRRREAVLSKYGGEEYLDGSDGLGGGRRRLKGKGEEKHETDDDDGGDVDAAAAAAERAAEERRVRFGASVREETYTRDGRVVKPGSSSSSLGGGGALQARKRVAIPSKYEEDVHQNGHTSVWGSYFHKGAFRWGYADDHSLLRNSYGTGPRGRVANDEANEMRYGTGVAGSARLARARAMLTPGGGSGGGGNRGDGAALAMGRPTGSRLYGEVANQHAEYDKDRLESALRKVEQDDRIGSILDDRKRKYNSLSGAGGEEGAGVSSTAEVTEEEMEAYRLRRERSDDPMAKLADEEELLEYEKRT